MKKVTSTHTPLNPAEAGIQFLAKDWVPALKGVYARLRGLCAGTNGEFRCPTGER